MSVLQLAIPPTKSPKIAQELPYAAFNDLAGKIYYDMKLSERVSDLEQFSTWTTHVYALRYRTIVSTL